MHGNTSHSHSSARASGLPRQANVGKTPAITKSFNAFILSKPCASCDYSRSLIETRKRAQPVFRVRKKKGKSVCRPAQNVRHGAASSAKFATSGIWEFDDAA